MAHLMSQPPSRSKQDVQLSSSHTYSYNENQIAPERQSIFFSLHVLVHHTSQKRRTFLVIDTSGSQVCVFSVHILVSDNLLRRRVHFWPLPSALIFNVPTNFHPTTTLLANASIPSIRSTLPSYYSTLYPPP